MNLLWSKVYDVIIKALLAGEHPIIQGMKRNCNYRTNCFELYGFDILIDSDLKPWLLEINLSPSLNPEDSNMDHIIKSNLVADTLSLVGLVKFDRRRESLNKMRNRMKSGSYKNRPTYKTGNQKQLLDEEEEGVRFGQINKDLSAEISASDETEQTKDSLKKLARVKNREILKETIQEYERKGNFIRILPAQGSDQYEKYF